MHAAILETRTQFSINLCILNCSRGYNSHATNYLIFFSNGATNGSVIRYAQHNFRKVNVAFAPNNPLIYTFNINLYTNEVCILPLPLLAHSSYQIYHESFVFIHLID